MKEEVICEQASQLLHLDAKVVELQKTVQSIKHSNYFRRLNRKAKNLQTKHSNQRKHISELRESKHQLITNIQKLKEECERHITQNEDLKVTIQEQAKVSNPETKKLITKEGTAYTDAIVNCVIQLIREVGVPATRCSEAIRCVSECLFHVTISDKDLPSERSNLRFADRGNVLCNMHVADTIINSQGYDLHSDGTSRSHSKYVGNQVTVSSGKVLSLGYNMVATENTQTFLDAATGSLLELAYVYSTDAKETDDIFKDILSKLIGLMSDRASIMKSFNQAFNKNV